MTDLCHAFIASAASELKATGTKPEASYPKLSVIKGPFHFSDEFQIAADGRFMRLEPCGQLSTCAVRLNLYQPKESLDALLTSEASFVVIGSASASSSVYFI